MRRIEVRGRDRGGTLPHLLLDDYKGFKMEYSQDNSSLQTSLLHEFITVSIESAILIMMVMIMVW